MDWQGIEGLHPIEMSVSRNLKFIRTERQSAERATIDQDVRRLEQEEQAERPALQARLVALYKLGGARYVHLMLSLSDVRQVGSSRSVSSAMPDFCASIEPKSRHHSQPISCEVRSIARCLSL